MKSNLSRVNYNTESWLTQGQICIAFERLSHIGRVRSEFSELDVEVIFNVLRQLVTFFIFKNCGWTAFKFK